MKSHFIFYLSFENVWQIWQNLIFIFPWQVSANREWTSSRIERGCGEFNGGLFRRFQKSEKKQFPVSIDNVYVSLIKMQIFWRTFSRTFEIGEWELFRMLEKYRFYFGNKKMFWCFRKTLAQAHARLSLREEVTYDDVVAIIYLYEESMCFLYGPSVLTCSNFMHRQVHEIREKMESFKVWLKSYLG